MRNLIGYLKKILLLSSLFFLFTPNSSIYAETGFSTYSSFEHTVSQSQIDTSVVLQFQSDTPRVISYYTASIPIPNIQPNCYDYLSMKKFDCSYFNRGSVTDILINLNNSVVKKDTPKEILLSYSTPNDTPQTYNLVSTILESTTNSIVVKYPKEKGEPLWSSDVIQGIKTSGEYMEVSISKPVYPTLSLIFGERVTYGFEIKKVFTNSEKEDNQTFEVYVPSDSSNQIVIWENLSPEPNITLKDEDGNYILKYIVAPGESLDCTITGYIQKLTDTIEEKVSKSYLTNKTGYWSITNTTEFKRVNTYLKKKGLDIDDDFDNVNDLEDVQKELFYKYIYQYVIDRLNFDKDVSLGISTETRLGANALTESSINASPTDYADFYISLLRKYMVPSRMVVGYISNVSGYTSDGFYHHWIEFYDSNKKSWVTSDPFLEEYFGKTLFGSPFHDHISIVKRGKSAVSPKISFFSDTDFTIKSENSDIKPILGVSSELKLEEYKITERYQKAYIYISNTGNIAINNYTIKNSNIDSPSRYIDPTTSFLSQIVLPKQNYRVQLNIPFEEIESSNMFFNISYRNGSSYSLDTVLESNVEIKTPLYLSFFSKILSLLIFSSCVFLIYLLTNYLLRKRNG